MKYFLKIFSFIFFYSQFYRLFFHFNKNACAVFTYHGVLPTSHKTYLSKNENGYNAKYILEDLFKQQVKWISELFTIIPIESFDNFFSKGSTQPLAVITFDDGYENNVTVAFPFLQKNKIPFTIFITTNFVDEQKYLWTDRTDYSLINTSKTQLKLCIKDETISFDLSSEKKRRQAIYKLRGILRSKSAKEILLLTDQLEKSSGKFLKKGDLSEYEIERYAPLSWSQIQMMVSSGLGTIGNHTYSHPNLRSLTTNEQKEEICMASNSIYSNTGKEVSVFAYPFGGKNSYSEETHQFFTQDMFAFTTEHGIARKGITQYEIPRIHLGMNITSKHELVTHILFGQIKKRIIRLILSFKKLFSTNK